MSSLNSNSGSVAVTTQARYNLTQPTYSDGTATELQADANGNLRVTFSGNISSNIAQVNGNTALAGNGVTGTGSLRVTIASDNTAFSVNAVQSGTWAVRLQDGAGSAVNLGQAVMTGSLPVTIASNQSALPSNISQVNGNTALAGNGVTGTGSLRVTIASDNTAFSVNAVQSGTWSTRLLDGAGVAVNKGQSNMAGSLPVTLASDQTAIPASYLSIIDQIDSSPGPVLDASVTTINGNAGAFVTLVASLAAATKRIRVADTTGQFMGLYVGGSGSEVLSFIINPGMDDYIDTAIAASTRISIRAMGTGSITSGQLCLQFSG